MEIQILILAYKGLISLSYMVNGVQLAQLEGCWSAEWEVVSSGPGPELLLYQLQ